MARLTPEQMAAYLAEAQKANERFSGGGQRPARIPDGVHRYRILPHWGTKSAVTPDAYRRYAQHWIRSATKSADANGKGSNIVATTLCSKASYQAPCPVCDAFWQAKQTPGLSKDIEDLIGGANANTRYLVNALHRNGVEPDKVIVLELPYKVGAGIFGDPKSGTPGLFGQAVQLFGAYPMDLEDGVDVVIRKTGSGFTTSYSVEYPNPIQSTPVNPAVLNQLHDLDAWVAALQHTPEDERRAIEALAQLANASAPNQALLMGGGSFVQAPAQSYQAPQYAQPQAQASAQPQAQAPQYAQAFDPNDDVFKDAAPQPQPHVADPAIDPAADMSDDDIESLLAGLKA